MVFYIYLKKRVIFEILPNFAPMFRGEGVEIEKNGPYQSESTFEELFKYEIRFSKSLAVVSDIGVEKMSQLGAICPFCTLFWENENFAEKWRLGQFIPLNAV